MKVAIFGRHIEPKFYSFINDLIVLLQNNKIEIVIYEEFYNYLINNSIIQNNIYPVFTDTTDADYVFSIGGDGTLLQILPFVKGGETPVLGINTGRLGFLSSVTTEEVELAIKAIIDNDFKIDVRTLLEFEPFEPFSTSNNLAMNEITIQKKDTSTMIIIHVYLDGEFLNSYWSDGLIVSTPTGSTAYSLSCNGPIVLPGSGNIIITPIAPHNLNVRPLVIPDDKKITLKMEGRTEEVLLGVDSNSYSVPLKRELNIQTSNKSIQLIRLNEYSYLSTLRNKLMWGFDKRN
ncbi:NAD kinase [bacterium]|nr:NAD kinase [bacterium]